MDCALAILGKYQKLVITTTLGMCGVILINALLVWALLQQRQSELHSLGTQVNQIGSVNERVMSTLLAPYGLTLKPQNDSFIVSVPLTLRTDTGQLNVYSSPLWLSNSHWFLAINTLLLIFFWRSIQLTRQQLLEVKRTKQSKRLPSPVNENIFGGLPPYQSIFAIVHCHRLSSVASGVASLLEALLQERLEHQQRVSVKILNSGSFAITVKEVRVKQLEEKLQSFNELVLGCCRSLLPELSEGDVKIGVCNYRSGADQAVVYQLTQSALALAKQSEHKHCYRIPFSHNHSMLLAAKSCSLVEAVKNNQFVCFFQPVFDLNNDEILHHETLLRIRHPQLGLISPEYLLSHDASEGTSRKVDEAVLSRLDKMLTNEELQAGVSVNIQPSAWLDDNFWPKLMSFLGDHPRVTLECPASLLAKQPNLIVKRLSDPVLQVQGVIIDQLSRWPADALKQVPVRIKAIKLASELVSHIDTDKHIQRRVLTYVAHAHRIGVPIYAVGIERQQQVNVLKQLGIRGAQGFYFTGTMNQISVFNSH